MKTLTSKKIILNSLISFFFFSSLFVESKEWVNIHPVPPALSDEKFQRLYQMLEIVSDIFREQKIEYFAEGQTLLGAVRHEGLIPWDPNLDIVVSMNDYLLITALEDQFSNYGLHVLKHPIYQYRLSIKDPFLDLSMEIHFYWISNDLFGRKKLFLAEHRFQYMNPNYFFLEEVYPLEIKNFGTLTIPIPNKPDNYLQRRYGNKWMKIALTETKYNGHSHRFEIQDFSPYPDNH
jgi:hypothetical protein